jgi:alpha-glucosidase
MKGRELPIWCQEQGHGRGSEPVTSVLSAGIGNPAGEWHTSYTCVPWTMTNTGRGLALENTERAVFDLREDDVFEVEVWHHSMQAQFIAGADPQALVQRYTEGFGRMQSLPDWTQDGAIIRAHGGSESVLATVAEAQETGVPLAGVWVEDWCGLRQTALGSRMWWNWSVDRSQYPDWEDMVAQLDAAGVSVLAYANPYLTDASEHPGMDRHLFEEAKAAGYLVRDLDGEIFWMDQAGFDAAVVDLSNPEAALWLQGVLEDLIDTGVKGWMADFAEGLPLDVTLHGGAPETWHNAWPEQWAAINDAAIQSAAKPDDFLVFHRSGNQYSPGLARAFWIGDQLVTWDAHDGIASVVPALISSGLSGYSMQHSDTGGYLSVSALGVTRGPELFERWVELNAFTPLVRMHSTNQPDVNHQWDTDEETTAHLAQMASTFAALAEYRAGLMQEAEEHGWPLIRPLFFHYPDDMMAWGIEDQFMLGPDLIVAPVVVKGQVTAEVYLPDGKWVHGPTGEITVGPEWVTVDAPIGSPAAFARKGSVAAAAL